MSIKRDNITVREWINDDNIEYAKELFERVAPVEIAKICEGCGVLEAFYQGFRIGTLTTIAHIKHAHGDLVEFGPELSDEP